MLWNQESISEILPGVTESQMLLHRLLNHQPLRFLAAGAWNTIFGYLVFLLADGLVGESYGVTNSLFIAYALALPQAFIVQRFWVFGRAEGWHPEFARFALSNTALFLANLLALRLVLQHTSISAATGQAMFLVVFTAIAYLAHKHFSFRR